MFYKRNRHQKQTQALAAVSSELKIVGGGDSIVEDLQGAGVLKTSITISNLLAHEPPTGTGSGPCVVSYIMLQINKFSLAHTGLPSEDGKACITAHLIVL